MPQVALIAGPTASGKSDLAVRLACALIAQGRKAEVINADSAQVYSDLAVLTARPAPNEMQAVPHCLFGTWDGAETCSAADWANQARSEISRIHSEGGVPILVGGTGMYLRTLLDGIAPVPPIDPAVRAMVRAMPVAQAYATLAGEDPAQAAKIAPSDRTRVCRALEVVRSTGKPLAAWQIERSGGIGATIDLHPAILLPPRDWLYARCDARFAQMLEDGAIAEVEALLARRLSPDLPVMRAIGVPEITALLGGSATQAETAQRGAQATRNYAKRQYTWLRHQPPTDWLRLEARNFNHDGIFARLLQY